jgi:hypothetical protein
LGEYERRARHDQLAGHKHARNDEWAGNQPAGNSQSSNQASCASGGVTFVIGQANKLDDIGKQKRGKIMKIKAGSLFLALGLGLSTAAAVTGITGCVGGPFSSNLNQSPTDFQPTWSGDDHAMPVYTSPTVTPATTNLPAANTPP